MRRFFFGVTGALVIASGILHGCGGGDTKPPPAQDTADAAKEAGSTVGLSCTDQTRISHPDIIDYRGTGGVDVYGTVSFTRSLPDKSSVRVELVPTTYEEIRLRLGPTIPLEPDEDGGIPDNGIRVTDRPTTSLTFYLAHIRTGDYYLRFSSESAIKDEDDSGIGGISSSDLAGYYSENGPTTRYEDATVVHIAADSVCGLDFTVDSFVCLSPAYGPCTTDDDCRGHVCACSGTDLLVTTGACDTNAKVCKTLWAQCGCAIPPDPVDGGTEGGYDAGPGPEGPCTGGLTQEL